MGAISLTQNKEYPAEDVSIQDELRDAGTELLNKKAITNYAKKLIDKRVNHKVTIAIIDIDDFKPSTIHMDICLAMRCCVMLRRY